MFEYNESFPLSALTDFISTHSQFMAFVLVQKFRPILFNALKRQKEKESEKNLSIIRIKGKMLRLSYI